MLNEKKIKCFSHFIRLSEIELSDFFRLIIQYFKGLRFYSLETKLTIKAFTLQVTDVETPNFVVTAELVSVHSVDTNQ